MKTRTVNIRDVARCAGVSRTTVSLVLNNSPIPAEKTRTKVLAVVKELNYQPDPIFQQAFRRRSPNLSATRSATRTIGFLAPPDLFERAQRDDGYYSRVLAGIQQALEQYHYHLMWKTAQTDALTLPEMVMEERVDGLLIEGSFPEIVRSLLAKRLPVVFIDRCYPDLEVISVMPNVERAIHEQLNYLWELGHRNIATFQHAAPLLVHIEMCLRAFRGFFAGKNHPIFQPALCEPRDITIETHAQVMAEYARQIAAARPRPTALITWDVYACALLIEFQKLGLRVPEDISVIGMDDTIAARLSRPQLTSYRFPMDEMGRSAAELLIQRIQDRNRPVRHIQINGQLIERGSCASVTSDQLVRHSLGEGGSSVISHQ